MRERTPDTTKDAFTLAKAWEESRIENRYTFDNYKYDLYEHPRNDQSYHPILPGQSLTYRGAKLMIDATQFRDPSADLFAPPKLMTKPTPLTQSNCRVSLDGYYQETCRSRS